MVLNATVGVTHPIYAVGLLKKNTLLDYFRPNPLLLVARLSLIVKGLIRFAID
jgi:hypothetical protein